MPPIVIVDKSSKHFSRFMLLLKSQSEVKIKDVKKIVSHSSYYAIIIKKLFSMNKVLREIDPELYLAEPTFSMSSTKNVFTALKRCDFVEIEGREDCFLIRFKK